MNISSQFSATGLSVIFFTPSIVYNSTTHLVTSYDLRGQELLTATGQLDRHQQASERLGGYWGGGFTMKAEPAFVERMLMEALNAHVEVRDAGGNVWEGFVNRVRANLGAQAVTRGPLTEVVNQARVIYSVLDTGTNPPTKGATTMTPWAYDDASCARWGVWQANVPAGERTAAEAVDRRDTALNDYRLPRTTKTWNTASLREPSVTFECLGYAHKFRAYVYEQTAFSGDQNLSDEIADVLDADPNQLFSSANARIEVNVKQVERYASGQESAWDRLVALCDFGDAADLPPNFGVYADRLVIYAAHPTAVEYHQHVYGDLADVQTPGGLPVAPWRVRPGKWLFYSDFLMGRIELPTPIRDDPRYSFLERVEHTAPYGLVLQDSHVTSLDQRLAKAGLGGE